MARGRPTFIMASLCLAASLSVVACSVDGAPAEPATVDSGMHESASPRDVAEEMSAESRTWSDYLGSLARSLQIEEPPEVEVVRLVVPEERPQVLVACVGDEGFPADAEGNRTFPSEQLEAFNLALYTCEARYPLDERFLQPLTEGQTREIHAYLMESAVPCLAELGYELPEPPSIETFVGTFNTADAYTLSSVLMDQGISGLTAENILSECPEFPPSADLYD